MRKVVFFIVIVLIGACEVRRVTTISHERRLEKNSQFMALLQPQDEVQKYAVAIQIPAETKAGAVLFRRRVEPNPTKPEKIATISSHQKSYIDPSVNEPGVYEYRLDDSDVRTEIEIPRDCLVQGKFVFQKDELTACYRIFVRDGAQLIAQGTHSKISTHDLIVQGKASVGTLNATTRKIEIRADFARGHLDIVAPHPEIAAIVQNPGAFTANVKLQDKSPRPVYVRIGNSRSQSCHDRMLPAEANGLYVNDAFDKGFYIDFKGDVHLISTKDDELTGVIVAPLAKLFEERCKLQGKTLDIDGGELLTGKFKHVAEKEAVRHNAGFAQLFLADKKLAAAEKDLLSYEVSVGFATKTITNYPFDARQFEVLDRLAKEPKVLGAFLANHGLSAVGLYDRKGRRFMSRGRTLLIPTGLEDTADVIVDKIKSGNYLALAKGGTNLDLRDFSAWDTFLQTFQHGISPFEPENDRELRPNYPR